MADTPFGLSFGQPSKYMGQSPLADIGKALKTGAAIWGLQKSGAIGALDKLGIKPDSSGSFKFNSSNAPAGAAAPPVGASGADMDMMSSGYGPAVPPQGAAPVMPQPDNTGVVVTPVSPGGPPEVAPMTPPPDIGSKILQGDDSWQHSAVNPQAERDSLVLPQQAGYNQMLATGNEYQQVPGYGSLKKAASMMMMG